MQDDLHIDVTPPARRRPADGSLDPTLHDPHYDPDRRVPCPCCGLPVGVRFRCLNRHVVTPPPSAGPDWRDVDGVRASPLNEDGYCVGSGNGLLAGIDGWRGGGQRPPS